MGWGTRVQANLVPAHTKCSNAGMLTMLMMTVPIGAICRRLWGCQCADDADADAEEADADDDCAGWCNMPEMGSTARRSTGVKLPPPLKTSNALLW